ncbi:MAG: iron-sulfur cluster assembly protein [Actinomycetota bacterium]|nr:iron-sulfur cluster assembly protein [Actinomycetota bacterium]
MTAASDLRAELTGMVAAAVAGVDDPEYPGVSIADLGLLERVEVDMDGHARIGLIPTFSGCPALDVIATDVHAAVTAVTGVSSVEVTWLGSPTWSTNRITPRGRKVLSNQFTVSVQDRDTPATCARCGNPTIEQSPFGPSRCRAVHRCNNCIEVVEVLRA